MNPSETIAALTAEDILKLKNEKMGNGCLWVTVVPAVLLLMFVIYGASWSPPQQATESAVIIAAAVIIPLLLIVPLYLFIRKKDSEIDADIIGGRKKVVVAPITGKRIESSEITRGREKGGISSECFMTVAGAEYPMLERKYLTIPVGEFMEMHLAPASKIVVRERWLKQDGTVEET